MLRFLFKRLLAILPVLLVVAVVVFLILRLTPGDPAAVIAGNSATNADIERIREQLGLNRSLLAQFGIWIGGVVQGDLGYSYYLGKPVTELIAQRVEPTLSLALGTIVLAVLVAVPLGTIAAWRMGGWLDRVLSGFSVEGGVLQAMDRQPGAQLTAEVEPVGDATKVRLPSAAASAIAVAVLLR